MDTQGDVPTETLDECWRGLCHVDRWDEHTSFGIMARIIASNWLPVALWIGAPYIMEMIASQL